MTAIECYNGQLNYNIGNAEKMMTLITAAQSIPGDQQHLVKEAIALFNQELKDQILQAAERLQRMHDLRANAKLKAESPEPEQVDS